MSPTATPAGSQSTGTTDSSAGPAARPHPRFGPLLVWCRRHAVFLVIMLVGIAWRIHVQLAFGPAFVVTDALAPVVAVQHLLGVATGIVIYVMLLRWGVWCWLAALATVPVLWNSYALASEQMLLPDTLFVFVVTVALLVLCWHARPNIAMALCGGALLGVASTVRSMGEPLVLVAVIFMLFAGATWRTRFAGALGVMVGFALPVVPYGAWYHHVHGEYAIAQSQADVASGYAPGPLLLAGLLLGLFAGVGLGRARPSGMRAVSLLTALVPAGTLLGAISTAEPSWRNQLPGLVLWPAAGALGLTALLRGRRGASTGRPQIDDVDRAAITAFRERYGDPTLAPVVVVIAAYNEAIGLPRVLARMPSTVCGVAADVLIVDDGSTDGTADAATAHDGAYFVISPAKRGQGAAMRLGYRIARGHGARYIITTDADAQYDTADFPTVLAPVLDGAADFVTGSRRLGRQHTIDRFRRAGVYVFAWIVSGLTGERLTDTSFGLRAMRAEITETVTLNQPQYQSAELLIGAHSHGYRIAEVPGTMHLRAAGSTKKGGNLIYGLRYARVVLGTWWREGCPAPARERAPAILGHRDPAIAPLGPDR